MDRIMLEQAVYLQKILNHLLKTIENWLLIALKFYE